jgi:hypothetical protein
MVVGRVWYCYLEDLGSHEVQTDHLQMGTGCTAKSVNCAGLQEIPFLRNLKLVSTSIGLWTHPASSSVGSVGKMEFKVDHSLSSSTFIKNAWSLPLCPLCTVIACYLDRAAALPLLLFCFLMLCWMYWVGFEVPTAVTRKSTNFWGVTPCSMVEVHQCFWGTYCLHLQGQRVSQARNQQEADGKQSSSHFCSLLGVFTWLSLWPWRWSQYAPPKCQWAFTGLHDVTSQKTVISVWTTCNLLTYPSIGVKRSASYVKIGEQYLI